MASVLVQSCPRAAQDDPEDPVGGPNARSPLRHEGGQLLAQGEILEKKVTARAHGRSDGRREGYQQAKHEAAENRGAASIRQRFCADRVVARHSCHESKHAEASCRARHETSMILAGTTSWRATPGEATAPARVAHRVGRRPNLFPGLRGEAPGRSRLGSSGESGPSGAQSRQGLEAAPTHDQAQGLLAVAVQAYSRRTAPHLTVGGRACVVLVLMRPRSCGALRWSSS